jgi:hypothetical protein
MSQLRLDSTVSLKDKDLVQAPNGGVLYMMNLKTGKYIYLNEVATQIWQHIKTPIAVAEVCRKLEAEFEVTPLQCQKEVLAFLGQLENMGNLEIR